MPDPTPATSLDEALFIPVAKKMQANLEMLMGRPIVFSPGPAVREHGEGLQALASTATVAFVAALSGEIEGRVLLLTDKPAALGIAGLVQMLPDATILQRIGDPAGIEFGDREVETLGEVGNFIVAAFSDVGRELAGTKVKFTLEPVVLGEVAPLLSGIESAAVSAGRVTVAGIFDSSCVLLVPESAVKVLSPKLIDTLLDAGAAQADDPEGPQDSGVHTESATEHADGGTKGPAREGAPPKTERVHMGASPSGASVDDIEASTASVVVLGSEAAAVLVGHAMPNGQAAAPLTSMGDLVKWLDAGVTPAVVAAEIPPGKEWSIEVLGTLRRHPAFATTKLVALLAAPTRGHVVRCAMAGFSAVVPTTVPEDVFRARLAGLLARGLRQRQSAPANAERA